MCVCMCVITQNRFELHFLQRWMSLGSFKISNSFKGTRENWMLTYIDFVIFKALSRFWSYDSFSLLSS